jgi:hypothetical protein
MTLSRARTDELIEEIVPERYTTEEGWPSAGRVDTLEQISRAKSERSVLGKLRDALLLDAQPELATDVGHWCALVVGPAIGWDQTILGMAVYDSVGALVYFRCHRIEKAIARGDWQSEWPAPELSAPENWAAMERTFEHIGNTMSHIRWVGGNPTLSWSRESNDNLFDVVCSKEGR